MRLLYNFLFVPEMASAFYGGFLLARTFSWFAVSLLLIGLALAITRGFLKALLNKA